MTFAYVTRLDLVLVLVGGHTSRSNSIACPNNLFFTSTIAVQYVCSLVYLLYITTKGLSLDSCTTAKSHLLGFIFKTLGKYFTKDNNGTYAYKLNQTNISLRKTRNSIETF